MDRARLTWLLLPLALAPVACRRSGPALVRERRVLMGTEVTVVAWDPRLGEREVGAAVADAFRRMEALERVLSRHREDSDLSRLNRAAGRGPVEVHPRLGQALSRAREAWEASGGAFDPTVGPLVRLWIRAAKENRLPDGDAVRESLGRTGFGKVGFSGSGLVALPEGFSLDLGGIAKGYIVDLGAEALRLAGVGNGMVEAGGDLFCFGNRVDGTPWKVGVQDPASGDATAPLFVKVLRVSGKGVTTSGHYRRYSTIEGRSYSHILDPRTGRPVEQAVLSVTVVAPDAAGADGLSTAVAVLGVERGLRLVESLDGVEALILTEAQEGGYALHASSGMKAYFDR